MSDLLFPIILMIHLEFIFVYSKGWIKVYIYFFQMTTYLFWAHLCPSLNQWFELPLFSCIWVPYYMGSTFVFYFSIPQASLLLLPVPHPLSQFPLTHNLMFHVRVTAFSPTCRKVFARFRLLPGLLLNYIQSLTLWLFLLLTCHVNPMISSLEILKK